MFKLFGRPTVRGKIALIFQREKKSRHPTLMEKKTNNYASLKMASTSMAPMWQRTETPNLKKVSTILLVKNYLILSLFNVTCTFFSNTFFYCP